MLLTGLTPDAVESGVVKVDMKMCQQKMTRTLWSTLKTALYVDRK